MPKSTTHISAERKAAAKQLREKLKGGPPIEQVLTADELADATPFYFVLRSFVVSLKAKRQERGLTLAALAQQCGLAEETLSRLETGALVNPTWQTLTRCATSLGCQVRLLLDDPTSST